MTDNIVPVSEAAREAAEPFQAPFKRFYDASAPSISERATWGFNLVQAFARFEAAIRTECATPAAPATGGVPDGWRLSQDRAQSFVEAVRSNVGPVSSVVEGAAAHRTEREALGPHAKSIDGDGFEDVRFLVGDNVYLQQRDAQIFLTRTSAAALCEALTPPTASSPTGSASAREEALRCKLNDAREDFANILLRLGERCYREAETIAGAAFANAEAALAQPQDDGARA